jgi:hypothetical protein
MGSGVSCDKLFAAQTAFLKLLALAPGSHAVDHTKPCKGRGEATHSQDFPDSKKSKWLIRLTLLSPMKNLFQQLTLLAA